MKTAIIIAFVCCLSLAVAQRNKCESNDDCEEGECCVRASSFSKPICKKLRQEEEFCFPNPDWNRLEDTYRFMCPCLEGLECKPAEVKEENGITTYVNARCLKPSSEE